MTLTLEQYPDAIASAEVVCLELQAAVLALAEQVEGQGAQFRAIVATDKSLTNEAQRKAGLAELQGSDPGYLALIEEQRRAVESLELARIEVRRLERLFRVAMVLHGFPE
jgi:hypothetical protein